MKWMLLILIGGAFVGLGCQQLPQSSAGLVIAQRSEPTQHAPNRVEEQHTAASGSEAVDDETPASRELLSRITYKRTGGFSAEESTVSVTRAGTYLTRRDWNGNNARSSTGTLNVDQRRELLTATANWNKLADQYLPAKMDEGDYRMEIQVGDKTVVVSDATERVPPKVMKVVQFLNGLLP